ncbi:irregular chiasm C-roughest protein-like isoform X2 [Amphibalanus amphitrite]|uniref:irregular chiasm C-roughest protein-like isoform X2 n=1 Tax=Amphibalanus amphitrite TaxID=1232801 RepID=UPI001C8FF6EA|nr:irregular chiasm C-roughest protein-like isoform X2 [Amphibalanus amphitrite]
MEGRWLAIVSWLSLIVAMTSAVQTFSTEPEDQSVETGQTVVLPCKVDGAAGAVQWTRDEFGLGVDRDLPSWPRYKMIGTDRDGVYSLEVQRVALEDDAVFQCQVGAAAGSPGIRSRNARLNVLVPPSAPRIVQGEDLSTTAGVVIKLQCESRGGKPPPKLEWFDSDGTQLENNITSEDRHMSDGKRYVVESTILLEPEARHDGANITCKAKNEALDEPQSVALTLHVKYPPEVAVEIDSTQVNEYDDVTFKCSATANPDDDLIFKWFIRDEVVVGDHGRELKLSSIGRELNSAAVKCDVTNEIGTGSHSVDLDIRYGPRFREEPKDASAEVGEKVTVKCDVDANPSPEIVWFKRDCEGCQKDRRFGGQRHHRRYQNYDVRPPPWRGYKVVGLGSELEITVTLNSVGRYECRAATTGFPEISRQLMVFARGRPEVSARSPQRGVAGGTVTVECVVTSVPAPSATVWYLYGRPIRTDSDRYKTVDEPIEGGVRSLLVISGASESDFGLYNCTFHNEYGADSATVLLQKQESVPLLIVLSGVVGGIIVIISAILLLVMCRRHRQPGGRAPADGSEKTSGRPSDQSSADTDLKMELRSTSSLSGQTASERWDDELSSYRYPDDMTDASFPPAQNNAGYISYPNYERDYAPSPVPASYADPRLSARYGNPYLRANSLTNLPPPAGYGARRAAATTATQHITAAGQPPPGRLATHV